MQINRIWFWALIVSLGGFLFGFDTAVISGAEGAIQREWSLSEVQVGQMVAMALYSTILGAIFGGTTHWLFAALIAGNFPALVAAFGTASIFTFFALCMIGQLLFVAFLMPETKGQSLEQMQL